MSSASTIIIIGKTRVEVLTIPRKYDKCRFFSRNGMLYKIYPDAFHRLVHRVDNGSELVDEPEEDSVIIFGENGIKPCNAGTILYEPSRIVAEIHANKLSLVGRKESISAKAGRDWVATIESIFPFLPVIMVGIVLVYALLVG